MEKEQLFGHYLGLSSPALDTLKPTATSSGTDDASTAPSSPKKRRIVTEKATGETTIPNGCTAKEAEAAVTDKKVRRRLQNRRAAKVSRARKKAYITQLEAKAEKLEEQVRLLLKQNRDLQDRVAALEKDPSSKSSRKEEDSDSTVAASSPSTKRKADELAESPAKKSRTGASIFGINTENSSSAVKSVDAMLSSMFSDMPSSLNLSEGKEEFSISTNTNTVPFVPQPPPPFEESQLKLGSSDFASSAVRSGILFPQQLVMSLVLTLVSLVLTGASKAYSATSVGRRKKMIGRFLTSSANARCHVSSTFLFSKGKKAMHHRIPCHLSQSEFGFYKTMSTSQNGLEIDKVFRDRIGSVR
mmetsp:Transcript_12961/g.23510  ORF Transcript_12961/g.23510 Transcript_12961/m.23510 type:complete len:358 (+) Transcript_12961:82-1155(+)